MEFFRSVSVHQWLFFQPLRRTERSRMSWSVIRSNYFLIFCAITVLKCTINVIKYKRLFYASFLPQNKKNTFRLYLVVQERLTILRKKWKRSRSVVLHYEDEAECKGEASISVVNLEKCLKWFKHAKFTCRIF